MALAANSIWEVRQGGSDTNGGLVRGDTVVTNYTLQNSPQVAVTNAVATGTTTITSASGLFTSAMVGNGVYMAGGTGSLVAIMHYIISVTNSTTIVVDSAVAAGTGITLNLGGAMASIGALGQLGIAQGHVAFVQNSGTPFVLTTATVNVSGGTISSGSTSQYVICGYTSNRTITNVDTPPTVKFPLAGFSVNMFIMRGIVRNIIFDGNGSGSSKLSGTSDATNYSRVGILNMTALNTAIGSFELCWATGCSQTVFTTQCFGCIGYANTAIPFIATSSILVNCISINNTGATTDGFGNAASQQCINCIAYNNGRAGFSLSAPGRSNSCINCISEGNVTYGYDLGATSNLPIQQLLNCAGYNNGTANFPTSTLYSSVILNFFALTGSAFTNAAGGDFSLNSTTGLGAALRAAGVLGTFPTGISTIGYQDIGAAQHQDTGGGSSTLAATFS